MLRLSASRVQRKKKNWLTEVHAFRVGQLGQHLHRVERVANRLRLDAAIPRVRVVLLSVVLAAWRRRHPVLKQAYVALVPGGGGGRRAARGHVALDAAGAVGALPHEDLWAAAVGVRRPRGES